MENNVTGLTADMREALLKSLQSWAEQGWPNAVIPIYHDIDGDDIPDYLGLTSFGHLEVLPETAVLAQDETAPGFDGPAWVRR